VDKLGITARTFAKSTYVLFQIQSCYDAHKKTLKTKFAKRCGCVSRIGKIEYERKNLI